MAQNCRESSTTTTVREPDPFAAPRPRAALSPSSLRFAIAFQAAVPRLCFAVRPAGRTADASTFFIAFLLLDRRFPVAVLSLYPLLPGRSNWVPTARGRPPERAGDTCSRSCFQYRRALATPACTG